MVLDIKHIPITETIFPALPLCPECKRKFLPSFHKLSNPMSSAHLGSLDFFLFLLNRSNKENFPIRCPNMHVSVKSWIQTKYKLAASSRKALWNIVQCAEKAHLQWCTYIYIHTYICRSFDRDKIFTFRIDFVTDIQLTGWINSTCPPTDTGTKTSGKIALESDLPLSSHPSIIVLEPCAAAGDC